MKTQNTPASKFLPFLTEMRKFIAHSRNGIRRMPNGARIQHATIVNYEAVYAVLARYESDTAEDLLIPLALKDQQREFKQLVRFWTRFRHKYISYLYRCGYKDVYVGLHLKVIRVFLNWLKKQRTYQVKGYEGLFTLPAEQLPVIALTTEHLQLLLNSGFKTSLSAQLQETLDLFLFGCATGLRYSDLEALAARNIQRINGSVYLVTTSQKTRTETLVKLPEFARDILNARRSMIKLLPFPSKPEFNMRVKALGAAAGWTQVVGKYRMQNGKRVEVKTKYGKSYRFCDLLSSHVMRKTTITTLLMAGVPEHAVRRISGHAPNSKEFFRYVRYSQQFLDEYTDKVFDGLAGARGKEA